MRVAHLTTVDLSLRYLVLPQMLAVVESGGEAIGISAPGPYVQELEALGIHHRPIESSTRGWAPLHDIRSAFRLLAILRRERPDVLHTHNPKPGVYGRIVGRLAGVPIVVNTIHGLYATTDDRISKRAVVYLLEWAASRFSDAELAQNPEDVALLNRLRLVSRSKLELLGNGIDLERFDAAAAAPLRAETRAELGVSESEIVVGAVGRLVAEKGYPELFEAMHQLGDGYVLVVAGPSDPEKADALPDDMLKAASNAGVRLLGMRTDVERLYGAFDIFVLASHREGFPRAAMEAAASGLPIVATDIRGCRQVVADGENGFLVPVVDPSALADAIRRLGTQPDLRRSMGAASERRARAEFDERDVVDRVLSTYRRVAYLKSMDLGLPPPAGRLRLEAARSIDVAVIAHLHADGIAQGFLSSLGPRFLHLLYSSLIDFPEGCVLVAKIGTQPVGFIAGCVDTPKFYRHFVRRRAFQAALATAPRLAQPAHFRRVFETLRYGSPGSRGGMAELLSMVVAADHRRKGVGHDLIRELVQWAVSLGAPSMTVVVGAHNQAAISLYREAGFEESAGLEIHAGEPSLELVWRNR